MLFNSFECLLFLLVVVLAYWSMPERFRPPSLLFASYFIYMSWKAECGLLIWDSPLALAFLIYMLASTEGKSVYNRVFSKLSRYFRKHAGHSGLNLAPDASAAELGGTLLDGIICGAEQMCNIQRLAPQAPAPILATAGIGSALATECKRNSCRLVELGLPAATDNIEFGKELNVLKRLAELPEAQFEFFDLKKQFLQFLSSGRESSFFCIWRSSQSKRS